MTVFSVSGLTKFFGGEPAANGLSFSVSTGDLYCLLGPNGAGKSTTVRIGMGLMRADEGTVSVFEHDPYRNPMAARQPVGYLPDQFAPFVNLTGREHLEYVRDASGTDDDLDRILSLVGLEGAGEKRATAYSEGMKQRLGLAMAIIGEPELLILDEPFANLDPDGADIARRIIEAERDRGAAILVTTHQIDVLDGVADRIGFVSEGTLLADGTHAELCQRAELETEMALTTPQPASACDRAATVPGVRSATVDGEIVRVTAESPAVESTLASTLPDADVISREEPTIRDLYREFVDADG
ncbi:ABC transporter ATP-binding protein [Halobacteria archaeon AArc-dxtr1]|nr:ABC transporter ATP-binding protein [Halobacteria archaeon AArc-dxtr1]